MESMLVQMRSWAHKQPLLVATLAAVLCGVGGGLALRQLHLNQDSLEVLGEMIKHTVTGQAHSSECNHQAQVACPWIANSILSGVLYPLMLQACQASCSSGEMSGMHGC